VGGVSYRYGIGQLEVTVAQYVAFLNTADPAGRSRHKLTTPCHHYSAPSPEWADKPYGFANFLRSARFVNSLYNG
jgi:hypothetical protein